MTQDYADAVAAAQETRCPTIDEELDQFRIQLGRMILDLCRVTCPSCKSPDTVSYWDIKQPEPSSTLALTTAIYREHYPNARKCVDCEHVWW